MEEEKQARDFDNEICEFIKTNRGKMEDEKLNEMIHEKFPVLNFGNCVTIDNRIYGNDQHRGYWRVSYGYPNNGDEVDCPTYDGYAKGIVDNVGFFTMSIILK